MQQAGEALSGSDQRRCERYPCPDYAEAFFASHWRTCGVADISAGGTLLETTNRLMWVILSRFSSNM